MSEYPIIFTGGSVRQIQADLKTQTRRLDERWMKVKAGDRIWCRETWTGTWLGNGEMQLVYAADGAEAVVRPPAEYVLPKAAARKETV